MQPRVDCTTLECRVNTKGGFQQSSVRRAKRHFVARSAARDKVDTKTAAIFDDTMATVTNLLKRFFGKTPEKSDEGDEEADKKASPDSQTSSLKEDVSEEGGNDEAWVSPQAGAGASSSSDEEEEYEEKKKKPSHRRRRKRKSSSEARWEDMYKQLATFKLENGHTLVLQNDGPLGKWVSTQRAKRRQGTLAKKHENMLDDLDFVWEAGNQSRYELIRQQKEKDFEDRVEILEVFRQENGHTNVPVDHPVLGQWLVDQRRWYSVGILSPSCIEALESIHGFQWDVSAGQSTTPVATSTTVARASTKRTRDVSFVDSQDEDSSDESTFGGGGGGGGAAEVDSGLKKRRLLSTPKGGPFSSDEVLAIKEGIITHGSGRWSAIKENSGGRLDRRSLSEIKMKGRALMRTNQV